MIFVQLIQYELVKNTQFPFKVETGSGTRRLRFEPDSLGRNCMQQHPLQSPGQLLACLDPDTDFVNGLLF